MISILIVEDNPQKSKNIKTLIDSIQEVSCYEIVPDIIMGKRLLGSSNFDLLILDLQVPLRFGDEPKPTNGIDFLKEVSLSTRLNKPYHIIGLSEYSDLVKDYKSSFEDDLWALITYNPSSTIWENQIRNKIEYLVQSKKSLKDPRNIPYLYDLAIVTALQTPELEAVLNLEENWETVKIPGDSTIYYRSKFVSDNNEINVIAGSAPQMGMVASTTVALKMIENFRPKYMAMTGIAGGVEGTGNFGDIIAADIVFDYGSGKTKELEGAAYLEPDYRAINVDSEIKDFLLSTKTNQELFFKIKSKWKGDKPSTDLNLIIGPLASGSSVVESPQMIQEIKKHSRKLVGVDMETYGVFYAATNCSNPKPKAVFSFKSISDFANPSKNDNYQKYSSYTSASFLRHFVLEHLEL